MHVHVESLGLFLPRMHTVFESHDGPIANFATDGHDLVRIAPSVSQTNLLHAL